MAPGAAIQARVPTGVAVRRQHGGSALLPRGPHRAYQEALQQRHRLLREAQCPAGGRGVDGQLQVPRVHGLEHPHERKLADRVGRGRAGGGGCPRGQPRGSSKAQPSHARGGLLDSSARTSLRNIMTFTKQSPFPAAVTLVGTPPSRHESSFPPRCEPLRGCRRGTAGSQSLLR